MATTSPGTSAPRELCLGAATVLFGERGGRYPQGNTLLVAGREETVVVDPSLGLVSRAAAPPRADRVLLSHCHEDHWAGLHLYPDVPVALHALDRPGLRSLDDMLAIYGYSPEIAEPFRRALVDQFHYTARPDAETIADGDVLELGGGVRLRVIHAPGHTRGHCLFHVEPDDVLYLGDVDLSSFGPYYGDAWSDLEAFESTLARLRDARAARYATFHHVGVVEGREPFLERLERFTAVIADREARLLAFLREPRSLDEAVAHRFVYRPQDAVPFADAVERRSTSQHLARLRRDGRIAEVEPGRYRATP